MKITIQKADLKDALTVGGRFAGRQKSMSILDCVKMKYYGGMLTVVSSDTSNTVSARRPASGGGEEGCVCAPFKELLGYVSLLDEGEVSLDATGDRLTVGQGLDSIELPAYPGDEFPSARLEGDCVEAELPSGVLSRFVRAASLFVSTDIMRRVLNGMYLYSAGGRLGYCATDSVMLANSEFVADGLPDFSFTLDRAAFQTVLDVAAGCETVKLRVGGGSALFAGGGASLLTAGLQGRFPNFKSVIPSGGFTAWAEADCLSLARAVEKACVGAALSAPLMRLDIGGGGIKLSSEDPGMGKKSEAHSEADTGGSVSIGLRKEKVLSVLKAMGPGRLRIDLVSPGRACVFTPRPSGGDVYVLMPSML